MSAEYVFIPKKITVKELIVLLLEHPLD